MERETCDICIEEFNLSTRKKVVCPSPSCGWEVCKRCVRKYLIETIEEPHCMACRVRWDVRFIVDTCNKNWVAREYRDRRRALLQEREKARLPETMELVERTIEAERLADRVRDVKRAIVDAQNKVLELRSEQAALTVAMYRVTREDRDRSDGPRRAFLMGCPRSECRGYLNEDYSCKLCGKIACSRCLSPKDDGHECTQDALDTAALVRSSTKPCPGCGERIQKVDGCDQMWCLNCHTAFSWRTGAIERGVIHNPEYFRYQREHGFELTRQPNNHCGDPNRDVVHSLNAANARAKFLSRADDAPTVPPAVLENAARAKSELYELVRFNNHARHVELAEANDALRRVRDTSDIRVKYIRGLITEEQLGSLAETADRQRSVRTRQANAWELLTSVSDDIMHSLSAGLNRVAVDCSTATDICSEIITIWTAHLNQYRDLVAMTNDVLLLANPNSTRINEIAELTSRERLGRSDRWMAWSPAETHHVTFSKFALRPREVRAPDRKAAATRYTYGVVEASVAE